MQPVVRGDRWNGIPTITILVNGQQPNITRNPTGDPGTLTNSNKFNIGARTGGSIPIDGHICEMIAVTSYLNTVQLDSAEKYLATKWGIALS
jgi:hypothetical protein